MLQSGFLHLGHSKVLSGDSGVLLLHLRLMFWRHSEMCGQLRGRCLIIFDISACHSHEVSENVPVKVRT